MVIMLNIHPDRACENARLPHIYRLSFNACFDRGKGDLTSQASNIFNMYIYIYTYREARQLQKMI